MMRTSAYGYIRTYSPHRNDDRFHPLSRHSSLLGAFSASNFKLRHYPWCHHFAQAARMYSPAPITKAATAVMPSQVGGDGEGFKGARGGRGGDGLAG